MFKYLKRFGAGLCVTLAAGASCADAAAGLAFPQTRAATYEEIRDLQSLGRVMLTPTGTFILVEWQRPYDWVPPNAGLDRNVASRKQTLIFKVKTNVDKPVPELLFQPSPGATYYLGGLSPDGARVSFVELNRDDNFARTGVVELGDSLVPEIRWFDPVPDRRYFGELHEWITREEFVYSEKGKGRGASHPMILVNAVTGKARAYDERADGQPTTDKQAFDNAAPVPPLWPTSSIPPEARLIASTEEGELQVFVVDTPKVLALLARQKSGGVRTIFNSERH
jgi:hypothetical protein